VTGAIENGRLQLDLRQGPRALHDDRILIVKGRTTGKEGGPSSSRSRSRLRAVPEKREVRLRIDATKAAAGMIRELAAGLRTSRGSHRLRRPDSRRRGRRSTPSAAVQGAAGSGLLRRGEDAAREPAVAESDQDAGSGSGPARARKYANHPFGVLEKRTDQGVGGAAHMRCSDKLIKFSSELLASVRIRLILKYPPAWGEPGRTFYRTDD